MKTTKAGDSRGGSDGGKRTSGGGAGEKRAKLHGEGRPHTAGHGGCVGSTGPLPDLKFSNDNCYLPREN